MVYWFFFPTKKHQNVHRSIPTKCQVPQVVVCCCLLNIIIPPGVVAGLLVCWFADAKYKDEEIRCVLGTYCFYWIAGLPEINAVSILELAVSVPYKGHEN